MDLVIQNKGIVSTSEKFMKARSAEIGDKLF